MNKRTLIIGCAVIVGMLATPTFARDNHHHNRGKNGLRTATKVVKLVTNVVGTQTQIVVVNPPPKPVVVHRPIVVAPKPKVEVKPQTHRRL